MSRPPRILTHEFPYHVICRCNNRDFHFQNEIDFRLFLQVIAATKHKLPFDLYAYVIMSNHVHMIIQPSPAAPLDKIMHQIKHTFTMRYNHRQKRCGHLWMNRYHAELIMEDSYLTTCIRYITRNPLRAKMVQSLDDWPWSSYHHYAKGAPDPLITPFNPLRHTPQNFKDLVLTPWPSDEISTT